MASAPTTVTVTPLEEKVVAVEQQVHNTQYALKFIGAAFASTFRTVHGHVYAIS